MIAKSLKNIYAVKLAKICKVYQTTPKTCIFWKWSLQNFDSGNFSDIPVVNTTTHRKQTDEFWRKENLPSRFRERGMYICRVLRKIFFLSKQNFAPSCCPNFEIFRKCSLRLGNVSVKFWSDLKHFWPRTALANKVHTLWIS